MVGEDEVMMILLEKAVWYFGSVMIIIGLLFMARHDIKCYPALIIGNAILVFQSYTLDQMNLILVNFVALLVTIYGFYQWRHHKYGI